MADNGQWFKLWCSADDDPDLGNLSNEDFGRWCKLGIYIKKHGTSGTIKLPAPALPLQNRFRVTSFEDVLKVLQLFPHISVVTDVTNATVTVNNWQYYQGDNSNERVRRFRERVTAKKRREEKRGEEKTLPPLPPSGEQRGKFPDESPSTALMAPALIPDSGQPVDGMPRRKRKREPSLATEYEPTWTQEPWPSVRKFVALYNQQAPLEWPKVELLSDTRVEKIKLYLRQFPKQQFWETVYKNARESRFCRIYKAANMEWILQKGRDGSENCLKIFEGKFDRE